MGIPWSDPVADGPVIEFKAGQRSLAKDVTLTAIIVEAFKNKNSGTLRPSTQFNNMVSKLLLRILQTSVKGLIIPDLPDEHAGFLYHSLI